MSLAGQCLWRLMTLIAELAGEVVVVDEVSLIKVLKN
jgi:hypothetical protein